MFTIYCITNKITGYTYIGQSLNVSSRWGTHRWSLTKGDHHCQHLQRSWNKYGQENFDWFIIENNLDQEQANELEQKLIRWFADADLSFNPYWNHKGRGEVSPEVRQKMREANLARGAKPPSRLGISNSPESIEKARQTRIKNAKPKKKRFCQECGIIELETVRKYCDECEKTRMHNFLTNREVSEEQKQRLRELRLGVPQTEEAKKKQSNKLKGKKPKNLEAIQVLRQKSFKVIDPQGQVCEAINLTEFCKTHGLERHRFGDMLNGRYKQYKGWKLV